MIPGEIVHTGPPVPLNPGRERVALRVVPGLRPEWAGPLDERAARQSDTSADGDTHA